MAVSLATSVCRFSANLHDNAIAGNNGERKLWLPFVQNVGPRLLMVNHCSAINVERN
jgi:hypothetical protein